MLTWQPLRLLHQLCRLNPRHSLQQGCRLPLACQLRQQQQVLRPMKVLQQTRVRQPVRQPSGFQQRQVLQAAMKTMMAPTLASICLAMARPWRGPRW